MWNWISANSSPLLFIVGAAGVVVACFTLAFIGVQTNAAKNAAKASLLQAEHTVTSERAWVVIGSSMKGFVLNSWENLEFWWAIRNSGNTPARIVETQCSYELVRSSDLTALPALPKYPEPIVLGGAFLAPGDTSEYVAYLTNASGHPVHILESSDVNVVLGGSYSLRAYGFAKYLDAFGNERESRFCEYFTISQRSRPRAVGFRPLIGVSAEYTKCT